MEQYISRLKKLLVSILVFFSVSMLFLFGVYIAITGKFPVVYTFLAIGFICGIFAALIAVNSAESKGSDEE